jgi:hypothetical protein
MDEWQTTMATLIRRAGALGYVFGFIMAIPGLVQMFNPACRVSTWQLLNPTPVQIIDRLNHGGTVR